MRIVSERKLFGVGSKIAAMCAMGGVLLASGAPAHGQSVAASSSQAAYGAVQAGHGAGSQSFHDSLAAIESSTHITEFLEAYPEYAIQEQREILAAQFTPEAAHALVKILAAGEMVILAERGPDGESQPRLIVNSASPEASPQDVGFPQCPSAWAALYAWAATEAAFCGALGLAGPGAALACVAAFTVLGTVPDFNAGC